MAQQSREAAWWEIADEGKVRCLLCPRACLIPDGGSGACLGRINKGGKLWADSYGRAAAMAIDPMEKKPLYHFHPGSSILSLGTYGCNLTCSFCQNYGISQRKAPTEDVTPESVVELAKREGVIGVAYTYNEPFIWYEFVRDCAAAVRAAGMKNVLVTNGYVNPWPLVELLPLIDAMNIDIKSFKDSFYQELCGAHLAPVLKTAKAAAKACHVEITNLIIPGKNDTPEEFAELAGWIAVELGKDTPTHLSAYFPRHKMAVEPTPLETLVLAREVFLTHLSHVYIGNMAVQGAGSTCCRHCGSVMVERYGYTTHIKGLSPEGMCSACGKATGIVIK